MEPLQCIRGDTLDITLHYNTAIDNGSGLDVVWMTRVIRNNQIIHESISREPLTQEEEEEEGFAEDPEQEGEEEIDQDKVKRT